ncbi:MAG: GyrI-like domain-containing protein [Anaerolineae bacterium]
MEPRFVTKAFHLVGVCACVPADDPSHAERIEATWKALRARAEQVSQRVNPDNWVCYRFSEDGPASYTILAAVECLPAVQHEALDGLTALSLPESRYAIFREAYPGEMGGLQGYAYATWLPVSGYSLNAAIPGELEVIVESTGEREVYVPIC